MKTTKSGIPRLWRTVWIVSGMVLSAFAFQNCAPHYVAVAPAPPVEVRPAPPYAGAVWVSGGWGWYGGRHVWHDGYYAHPRPGRAWHDGEWRSSPRGYYYVHGRWR